MTSARLAAILSVCFAFAAAANAQLAEADSASERDNRAAAPTPPTPGISEEASPADNSTAATANSLSICQMVESAAAVNGLPFEFFARVIWQESRFRPDTVGPITRTGQRAQGIAQFMPKTAAERLLHDPLDPVQALPKSAEFLRELRAQFGNLGLAAAAYNAGPQRVRDWLAGKRTLPSETQIYVRNVTGRSAQEWARPDQKSLALTIPTEMSCAQIQTAKLIAKPQSPSAVVRPKPMSDWGVQLVGDRSEITALAVYRQLQKKHETILGGYEPVVIRTTVKMSSAPIWNRIRIGADTREAAQALCSRLRAVGENCLVQHN
jgi:transglycosylase-like protein with SLT domain/sporulation related protein